MTAILLVVLFKPPTRHALGLRYFDKLKRLDLPGFLIFVPAVVMLLLALQWGGNLYQWKSVTIIGLICGAAGLMVCFAVWQWHEEDQAGIPPSVFTQRTVFFGAIVAFFAMGGLQLITYWLPIWFQVIKDASPTQSGINYFPTVLGNVVFSLLAGILGAICSSCSNKLQTNGTALSYEARILQPMAVVRDSVDCHRSGLGIHFQS